jgi:hypothetical protein
MQPQTMPQAGAGTQPSYEQIAKRAYEKWCKRGKPQGGDRQDWFEAEAELKKEMATARR